MAKIRSCEEMLPKASTPELGTRTLQTTDRQTDRRMCDSKDPNVK